MLGGFQGPFVFFQDAYSILEKIRHMLSESSLWLGGWEALGRCQGLSWRSSALPNGKLLDADLLCVQLLSHVPESPSFQRGCRVSWAWRPQN